MNETSIAFEKSLYLCRLHRISIGVSRDYDKILLEYRCRECGGAIAFIKACGSDRAIAFIKECGSEKTSTRVLVGADGELLRRWKLHCCPNHTSPILFGKGGANCKVH